MHQASLGNYNIVYTFRGDDELSDAFANLKKTIENIKEKEALYYTAQLNEQRLINKQQQMEFNMLAGQINPNFLYNTLETIRVQALSHEYRDVASSISLLGKSMRYVLENTGTSTTSLKKELDYIKTYLAIQKLRFGERVNAAFDIPEAYDTDATELLPILTYGPAVTSLEGLHTSYEACCMLLERRFFCAENQHVLSYEQLPQLPLADVALDSEQCKFYSDRFVSCIQSFNHRRLTALLGKLHQMLYGCNQSIDAIKYFLIDIFLQIKQSITYHYGTIEIPFPHNAAIMELLTKKYYLHEILAYFHEQSEMIMRAIGNNSSESILDDILYYIDHNYQENLKLKTLTSLFGYNSSYLGKLFKERVGMNFNTYLDTVRVKKAADLLTQTDLRIYEISAKVGYKNADYFQQKFKKIKGINPTDYRVCPYEEKQR